MSKFLNYFDPPARASFTGHTSFKHTVKNKNKLNDWLLEQEPYTLHRPLRKKFLLEKALTTIFKSRQPVKFQTDKGREFLNKPVQDYLKKMNIHFYTKIFELKASVVERFNRTFKEKMWRYITYKNNNDYTKVLDNLVDSYNNTYHRTIKTTPSNVS
ncbi:unnamed protein product, partial [Brachionus calyciflorus]